ncbi:hypothetical protein MVEN_02208700 [Mycena venus]|uniref:Uncharacterized protein n=1 Tax=Mycena venus TaxID=2733690 RepID=A0A8H7CHF2_9AGAR|nr:hypothetical protein MVEN_02208700 [Mycena venus]
MGTCCPRPPPRVSNALILSAFLEAFISNIYLDPGVNNRGIDEGYKAYRPFTSGLDFLYETRLTAAILDWSALPSALGGSSKATCLANKQNLSLDLKPPPSPLTFYLALDLSATPFEPNRLRHAPLSTRLDSTPIRLASDTNKVTAVTRRPNYPADIRPVGYQEGEKQASGARTGYLRASFLASQGVVITLYLPAESLGRGRYVDASRSTSSKTPCESMGVPQCCWAPVLRRTCTRLEPSPPADSTSTTRHPRHSRSTSDIEDSTSTGGNRGSREILCGLAVFFVAFFSVVEEISRTGGNTLARPLSWASSLRRKAD